MYALVAANYSIISLHKLQPMTITIEELQFQGRVESYIIWAVPALVIPSCVGTMWNIRMKETVTLNSDITRY